MTTTWVPIIIELFLLFTSFLVFNAKNKNS
jgi:hypothetical protein